MGPNLEQIKSIARDLLQIMGTLLVAFKLFAVTEENWSVITGAVLMLIPIIWGLFNHTQANAVAIAAAIPEVKRVVVEGTPAGEALAKSAGSTPSALVVVAPEMETKKGN